MTPATSPATSPSTRNRTPSARAVLLTLFGDVVLATGGQAWSGALTAAMVHLGVAPTTTRQALRRLTNQGLVVPHRHGRQTRYAVTDAGHRRLWEAADRIYLRHRRVWDGRWRMLSYSFPEHHRAARASLRRELAWLGYGALSPGLWICPWDLGTRRDAVLTKHDVASSMFSFTSSLDGDDRQLAAQAYDLVELAAVHRRFLDRYEDSAPQPNGVPQQREGAALAARVRLVHEWRRFLFLDPGLPDELLPHDWIGDRAATVFLGHYRRLDAPAWRDWQRLYAASDPGGEAPTPEASNLDVAAHNLAPHDMESFDAAASGSVGSDPAAGASTLDTTSPDGAARNGAARNGSRPHLDEPEFTDVYDAAGGDHILAPDQGGQHG